MMELISRDEALKQGKIRYYTGKPCKRGHISERIVSGYACLECARLQAAERRADPVSYAVQLERSKDWSDRNREYHRAINRDWAAKNSDKVKANIHRRKKAVGGDARWSDELISLLLSEQGGKCPGCSVCIENGNHSIDHVVAVSQGGSNDPSNIQLLCGPCNSSKKNRSLMEWLLSKGVIS